MNRFRWSRNAKKDPPVTIDEILDRTLREPLFQTGAFTLASGQPSKWKIACDSLTAVDWDALALMTVERFGYPNWIEGVPRGGLPFAEALLPYCTDGGANWLVDDVYTSGGSINEFRAEEERRMGYSGVVVFARNVPPPWIYALFTMAPVLPNRLVESVRGTIRGGLDG